MPISDKQIQKAKKLQKQTFMAFEKIDDKSECLVDDTNATSIATKEIVEQQPHQRKKDQNQYPRKTLYGVSIIQNNNDNGPDDCYRQ